MQPRQIARELALLSLSQMPRETGKLSAQQLQDMMLAAVRTLSNEASSALEMAAAELQRGSDRLLDSETIAPNLASAKAMVKEAIELTSTAINRLGSTIDFPEIVYQSSNIKEVQDYALEIIGLVKSKRTEVDRILSQALVNWQLDRLAKIDRDILRIAVVEIWDIGVDERVAINEAVELAKRYGNEEEYRFINGVLRRVLNLLAEESSQMSREN
ncbi:MAG: transcription antitermination protein NusB [Hormoscilla sp. GM7CHS1pb]|nr:transcription antitermination protein NusB [Hormoscilla sp. GM7CHS1pb]